MRIAQSGLGLCVVLLTSTGVVAAPPEPKPLTTIPVNAKGVIGVDAQWMGFVASDTILAMRYVQRESADATVAVFHLDTGKALVSATIKKGGGKFSTIEIPCGASPKGDWVVYGEDETLRFLAIPPHKSELPSGGRLKLSVRRAEDLVGVWLDEKGESAFVGRDLADTCELERWDLAKQTVHPVRRLMQEPTGAVMTLSVPTGRVAVARRDLETREPSIVCSTFGEKPATITIKPRIPATSLVFSPDGKMLFVGCADGSIAWYDTATAKIVKQTPRLGRFSVGSVAVHPGGKHLACGTWDMGGPNLFLLDVTSGEVLAKLTADARAVLRTCFSPSGEKLAAFGSSGNVTVWNATSLLKLQRD